MVLLHEIRPRRLEGVVRELMTDEPVIVLAGPRTVGKSTLLRRLASDLGADVIDLDDVTTRLLVENDLALYASGPRPVLIDEFQHVPQLLDAIKAELNRDPSPGRFILTGSTRYSTLPRAAQSLTGRVHVEAVWPLSQGEIHGATETFLSDLLARGAPVMRRSPSTTTRDEYVERVLAGGMPAVLHRRPGASRSRWYQDYLALVVARDVLEISKIRQASVLPAFLRAVAAQTAQLLNVAKAATSCGIAPSVGEDYLRLLESVFLIHRLPAWGTTLRSRVNRLPKAHLVDSGVGAWLLGVTPAGLARRRPAIMTEFGHLLETFAVNELLKQAAWTAEPVHAGHFRTSDGHEVDLILEFPDGTCAGFEVKAGATLRAGDERGLARLRDHLGDRFLCGVLLYLGERNTRLTDSVYALPVDRLWT